MIWKARKEKKHILPSMPWFVIDGERLSVRPPKISDYKQWKKIRSRNEKFLKPYEPSWPEECLSENFFESRIRRQSQDWARDRAYAFLIFKKEADALIGGVNINNVSRGAAQYASLGYWIDESEQGQGYMSEALTLVIGYGFNELNLHRFNAGCLKDNEKSVRLLQRLGFTEEGLAQKYIQIDGKWQDHRLFGLPIEHWH